jgi:pyruvate dehydrogenase E2 component (dihydrolipoamide acetyltransferase)
MADGVISKWLKQVGEPVKRGEPLFEVESDKVTTEVESPADGVVLRLAVDEGTKVDVGVVLAVIGRPGEQTASSGPALAREATPPSAPAVSTIAPPPPAAPTEAERIFVSPRARKTAEELGVDLSHLRGTGPGGRILERDVIAAAPSAVPVTSPAPSAPLPAGPGTPPLPRVDGGNVLPLAGMRRTIAERMVHSQQTVAEVTLTAEVDVGEIVKLRAQVGDEWEKQYGFKVSYTEVIVKAVGKALREHPYLNSSLTDAGIQLHSDVNVGFAVAIDEGLIVPVVRQADHKALVEIARAVRDLSERARLSQLTRDDVGGGTFTISNMGMLGVEAFTPIVNWPECAILGVGRIADRAVVRDGQIVARPTMWLSLTFDHRIVDGAPAGRFLGRVRQLLESPYLLFV